MKRFPACVDICGIRHAIVFVGKKRMRKENDGVEVLGCVDADNAIIYLAKSLRRNRTLVRDTVIHEVVGHAVLKQSGIVNWLRTQTKKRGKKFYEFEETFVRLYTPHVVMALKSLNLLQRSK